MSHSVNAVFFIAGFISICSPAIGFAAPQTLPVQQIAKLTPDDGGPYKYFGISSTLSSDWVVVGAHYTNTGGAYVFNAKTGGQVSKLLPNDFGASDEFGQSVAISGRRALVGAPSDSDQGARSGSAYIFDVTTGAQLAKLLPSDGAANAVFGWSVAVDGDIAVIGAPSASPKGMSSGAAYVFNISTGAQLAKLVPNDGGYSNEFGGAVGISGDRILVGAKGNDNYSGAAYVFSASTGAQMAKLVANDRSSGVRFSQALAIDGDTAVIGAGLDGPNGQLSGSAYLFDLTTGQQRAKITPHDGAANDRFGDSVAISGSVAVVGAFNKPASAGAAYLFDAVTGVELAKVLPEGGAGEMRFSNSIGISANRLVFGAYQDGANGINSGAAFLFTIPEPSGLALLATGALAALLRTGRRA
ncbi:FG-GAP repeat protein [Lacipirellula sp.]|uniref:FG-GAP repeat protein n=1 Tax=Lacipirellula sp. TaxID=2691419 RepID=UPI003D0BA1AE